MYKCSCRRDEFLCLRVNWWLNLPKIQLLLRKFRELILILKKKLDNRPIQIFSITYVWCSSCIVDLNGAFCSSIAMRHLQVCIFLCLLVGSPCKTYLYALHWGINFFWHFQFEFKNQTKYQPAYYMQMNYTFLSECNMEALSNAQTSINSGSTNISSAKMAQLQFRFFFIFL